MVLELAELVEALAVEGAEMTKRASISSSDLPSFSRSDAALMQRLMSTLPRSVIRSPLASAFTALKASW
jgi:hypothetical protein